MTSLNPIHLQKYILHRRGDNRNMLSIYTQKHDLMFKLNGDRSRLQENFDLSSEEVQEITDKVNSLRIQKILSPYGCL